MTTITLTYADMNSAAARMDAKQQQMATELLRLKTIVSALVASDFKTVKASPAYETLVDNTVDGLAKAIAAIGQFAEVLRSAASAYHDTDGQLAKNINGGSATATLQLDMDEISHLKSHLKSTLDAFNDVHDVSGVLTGDVLGSQHVADAVHDFSHDWEKKRGEIIKNVDTVGQAVSGIHDNFAKIDTDLAKSLQTRN